MSIFVNSGGRSSKGLSTPYMLNIKDRLFEMPSYNSIFGVRENKIYCTAINGTMLDDDRLEMDAKSIFTINIDTGKKELYNSYKFQEIRNETANWRSHNEIFPTDYNFITIESDRIIYTVYDRYSGPGSSQYTYDYYVYELKKGGSSITLLGKFRNIYQSSSTGYRGCQLNFMMHAADGYYYMSHYYDVDYSYTLRRISDADMKSNKFLGTLNIDEWDSSTIVWKIGGSKSQLNSAVETYGYSFSNYEAINGTIMMGGRHNVVTLEKLYQVAGYEYPNPDYIGNGNTIYDKNGNPLVIYPQNPFTFGTVRCTSSNGSKFILYGEYLYTWQYDNNMYKIKIV